MSCPECCCLPCCDWFVWFDRCHLNSRKVFAAPMIIFFLRIPIFTTLISYIQMTWCRWHLETFDFPIKLSKSSLLNLILFSISPWAIILISVYIATSMNFILLIRCSSLSFIRNFTFHPLSFNHRIMNFFLISCTNLNENLWNIILVSIIPLYSILFPYLQCLYLLNLIHIFKTPNYW